MSERQEEYKIAPAKDSQTQEKAQPIGITLNSEQVRGVIHCAAQKSPGLIVAEAVKALARDTSSLKQDLLSESETKMIMSAIIEKYPEMSRRIIDNMDNVQGKGS